MSNPVIIDYPKNSEELQKLFREIVSDPAFVRSANLVRSKNNKGSYRFFYHFNKPLTKKTGKVVWSVHFRKKCYMVSNIRCMVPTETKTNKVQPIGVVQGFCREVKIENNVAFII